jgi:hypothetical protein
MANQGGLPCVFRLGFELVLMQRGCARLSRERKTARWGGQFPVLAAICDGASRTEAARIRNDIHFGADAMHMMAILGEGSDLFARINYRLFHSRRFSMFIYPILRSGRALLLKLLGRKKING